MRFFFTLLIVLYAVCLFAQSEDITSQNDWRKMQPKNSNKDLNQYAELFNQFYEWDISVQEEYLSIGLHAAKFLKNDTLAYEFTYQLGNLDLSQDSLINALEHFSNALQFAKNPKTKADNYNILGFVYSSLLDYQTSLDYYFKAIKIKNDIDVISNAYTLINVSGVYSDIEDYKNAIKYVKEANLLANRMDFPEKEYVHTFGYVYLADYFSSMNQIDSSLYYTDLSLKEIEKIDTVKQHKYSELIKMVLVEAANIYLLAGREEIGFTYLQKLKTFQLTYTKNRALILDARYEMKRNNYRNALKILEIFEADEPLLGDNEEILELKIECYQKLNDYPNALNAQKDLIQLQKDKIKSNSIRDAMLADVKYETFKKNEEIKALKLNQEVQDLTLKNQRFFSIIISIIGLLVAIIAIFFWYRYQNRKKLSVYLQREVEIKTRDLQYANEDLELLNEELRTFNYIASHDIKEPIRNIGNYASLAYRKLPADLKFSLGDYFKVIKHGTSQLYTLLEDFARYTSLSQREIITQETVHLNTIIENLQYVFLEKLQKNNGKIINKGLVSIHSSPSLIYIILKNIIDNGLKFNESPAPIVWLSHQEDDKVHNIIIKDNGIGMDEIYFERIFDMFSRLHERGKYTGSGIGLAIAKLLVQKLNGEILVESVPNQGSTFKIVLPKASL